MIPLIPICIFIKACLVSSFSKPRSWLTRLLYIIFIGIFSVIVPVDICAQEEAIVLSEDKLNQFSMINFSELEGWKYTHSFESGWLHSDYDDEHWESINLKDFSLLERNESRVEAWFRIKISIDSSLSQQHLSLIAGTLSALDLYLNGELIRQYGVPNLDSKIFKSNDPTFKLGDPVYLKPGEVYTIGIYFVDLYSYLIAKYTNRQINPKPRLFLKTHHYNEVLFNNNDKSIIYTWLGPLLLLSGLFWLMYFQNKDEKTVFLVAIFTTSLTILCWSINIGQLYIAGVLTNFSFQFLVVISSTVAVAIIPLIIDKLLTNKISKGYRYLFWVLFVTNCLGFLLLKSHAWLQLGLVGLVIVTSIHLSIKRRAHIKTLQWVMLSGMLFTIFCIVIFLIIRFNSFGAFIHESVVTGIYLSMPISMLIYFTIRFKNNLLAARSNAAKVLQLSSEKEKLIEAQKTELEHQVKARTEELVKSMDDLKSTQALLIQSEKMASLGELTSGIAHEIQNPLNFVNNFSEVSAELVDEMREELLKGEIEEGIAIANDLKQNLVKINHHGKKADAIVKGMLQHSKTNTGQKQKSNINLLCEEYLRLSYHGFLAKDALFSPTYEVDLEKNLPLVDVVPQDIGRVLLNLINNAFYAVHEKSKEDLLDYQPLVLVSTCWKGNHIEVSVKDNGNGIPDAIKAKIFQPFFTTKPTGQGTGLGLSLSYDIVKAHGGELNVESEIGLGTTFSIKIPVT